MIKEKFTTCWKGIDAEVYVEYYVDRELKKLEYVEIIINGEPQEINEELAAACNKWLLMM